jgi:uncharacterized membrane protein YoaK (UPF0700 family)
MTTSTPASLAYILVALGAFAMGLQMNAIRSLHVPGISTTAFTATFISLASGIASRSLEAHSARRLTATMVSMAAGAFLGDWMLGHAHPYAPVVPLIVIAGVIWVASVALRPRATPGPAGPQGSPVQRTLARAGGFLPTQGGRPRYSDSGHAKIPVDGHVGSRPADG